MPAAHQRSAICPSRQRLTLRAVFPIPPRQFLTIAPLSLCIEVGEQ
jgi:hypothetical protein